MTLRSFLPNEIKPSRTAPGFQVCELFETSFMNVAQITLDAKTTFPEKGLKYNRDVDMLVYIISGKGQLEYCLPGENEVIVEALVPGKYILIEKCTKYCFTVGKDENLVLSATSTPPWTPEQSLIYE